MSTIYLVDVVGMRRFELFDSFTKSLLSLNELGQELRLDFILVGCPPGASANYILKPIALRSAFISQLLGCVHLRATARLRSSSSAHLPFRREP